MNGGDGYAISLGAVGICVALFAVAIVGIWLGRILRAVLDIRDELRWSNRVPLARDIAEAVRRDDDDGPPKPSALFPPSSSK